MYVNGKWTAAVDDGTVMLKKKVRACCASAASPKTIAATSPCATARGEKAWKADVLDQSKARIRTLVLGRSEYRGWTWIEPEKGKRQTEFWCLAQDAKTAAQIELTTTDKTVRDFVEKQLVRQLAVRRAVR